jgi:hypothetical protein
MIKGYNHWHAFNLFEEIIKNIVRFEVSTAVTMKNALVRTDVSEERGTSIITLTKIGELGTTLAISSN